MTMFFLKIATTTLTLPLEPSNSLFSRYWHSAHFYEAKLKSIHTRKSVHRTRMPPPNAIQKKGLYVTVTGIPDTVNYMGPSQGEIIQKPKNARVVFLVHVTSSQCDACTGKVS